MPIWDEHKDTLWRLYVVEDKKRDEIMKTMREKYDFDANLQPKNNSRPNQYDRKFKEWGFRKNLKSKEWRVVKSRVAKSKRAGKQCDVFVGGVLVPKDKFEKEIRRNDFPSIEERYGQAPSPATPEGVYICTPPATTDDTRLIANLPWVGFLRMISGEEEEANLVPDLGLLAVNLPNIARGFLSLPEFVKCTAELYVDQAVPFATPCISTRGRHVR